VASNQPANHLRLDDLATRFSNQPCELLAASESRGNAAVTIKQSRRFDVEPLAVPVENGECILYPLSSRFQSVRVWPELLGSAKLVNFAECSPKNRWRIYVNLIIGLKLDVSVLPFCRRLTFD